MGRPSLVVRLGSLGLLARLGLLGLLGLILAACAREPSPVVGSVPVLVIGLDAVRADYLGCYGHPFVETPALDALAAESVLFENCASPATWTLPAFASAFTGLYPYRHGAVGGERARLAAPLTTLGEWLAEAGYQSKGFAGFDYFRAETQLAQGIDSMEIYVSGPTSDRSARYQEQVLRWIRNAPREDPWFLFVHYYDAHAPYEPPAGFDRRYYTGDPYDPAHTGLEMLNTSNNRAMAFRDISSLYSWMYGVTDPEFAPRQYAADIAALDRRIAELIGQLRESGWLDRMLVVVMADHGEHLNEHSCWYTHAYPYQECLHVPLLVRLPDAKLAGRRIDDEVSLVDLFPTLVELLGGQAPAGLDGISLVPVMEGEPLPARILQAEQGSSSEKYVKALWDADWRFLYFRMPSQSWVELYDRRSDRAETRDVSAEHPEIVRRFEAELARRFPEDSPLMDPRVEQGEPLSEELEQRLRSLGYVH